MRSSGVRRRSVHDLGPHDHLCWAYDDPVGLRGRLVEFLTDGILHGQRIVYVSAAPVDTLREHLRGLYDVDGLLVRGALRLLDLGAAFGRDAVVDPAGQVAQWAAATKAALAAGFTGLRIAADVSPLVATPLQRGAFARYEHRLDRFMVDHPFAALCAYDRGRVDRAGLAELACLHPWISLDAAPFRLFAAGAGRLVLEGDVDALSAPLFALALTRVGEAWPGAGVVVDVADDAYVGHRGLVALERAAAGRAVGAVVVRHRSSVTALLAGHLDLTRVRVEPRP
jgi:hypothetical protein